MKVSKASAERLDIDSDLYRKIPKNLKYLDTGIQSSAYLHKPTNTILKHTALPANEGNPVYQFIRLASNHQDNPYFPKIHNTKGYSKDGKTARLLIKMEKAKPLNKKEILKCVKLFGFSLSELGPYDFDNWNNTFTKTFNEVATRRQLYANIVDNDLKQALRLLEPLFQHYNPDMHFGNIMVRSDGHIIIMDPIGW